MLLSISSSSTAESAYSFEKESTLSGFRDIADAFLSPSQENICILTYDTISVVNITSMKVVIQRQFDDITFRDGCWINETIFVSVLPKHPEGQQLDDILVLSSTELTQLAGYTPLPDNVMGLAASPDNSRIAAFVYNDLYVFDKDTFSLEYHFGDHAASVREIAWSPDSAHLASIGGDFWIHDMVSGSQQRISAGFMGSSGVFWAPDGTVVYNLNSPGNETLDSYNIISHERTSSEGLAYTINTGALNFEMNDICIGVESDMEILSLNPVRMLFKSSDAADDIRYIFWSWDWYRIITLADDGVLRSFVDENHPHYNHPPTIVVESPLQFGVVTASFVARGTISDDSGQTIGFYQLNSGPWRLLNNALSWSVDVNASDLSVGRNQLSVKAIDGEKESFTQVVFFYDPGGSRPTVEMTGPANGSRVGRVLTVEGTAHDPAGAPLTVLLRVDGGGWSVAEGSARWTYTMIIRTDQPKSIFVEAKALNSRMESEVQARTYLFDPASSAGNRRPVLTIKYPVEAEELVLDMGFEGEVDDDNSTLTTLLSFDGMSWTVLSSQRSFSGAVPVSWMSPGMLSVHFVTYDGELLSEVKVRNVTKVAYLAPEVVVIQPSAGQYIQGDLQLNGFVKKGYGDVFHVELSLNGGEWMSTSCHRFWNYTFNETELIDGNNTVQIRTSDGYSTSDTVTMTVCYLNPFYIAIVAPLDGTHVTGDVPVRGVVTGGGNGNIAVEVRVNGGEWYHVFDGRNWTCLLKASDLALGNNTIEARAYNGEEYSANFTVGFYLESGTESPEEADQWLIVVAVMLVALLLIVGYSLYLRSLPKKNA
jgi:hypothetical protein